MILQPTKGWHAFSKIIVSQAKEKNCNGKGEGIGEKKKERKIDKECGAEWKGRRGHEFNGRG